MNTVAKYLLLIFVAAGFVAIVQRMALIYSQYQHLTDENLRGFWDGTLRKKDKKEYDRVIAHLGLCEKCQKQLHEFEEQKTDIENHLINDPEDDLG